MPVSASLVDAASIVQKSLKFAFHVRKSDRETVKGIPVLHELRMAMIERRSALFTRLEEMKQRIKELTCVCGCVLLRA